MNTLSKLNKSQLQAMLNEQKIEFKKNAIKKTLIELLKESATKKEAPKKKAVKKKAKLTEAQKIENAKKRALTPNIANVISKAVKLNEKKIKSNFTDMLIRTKQGSDLIENLDLTSILNMEYITKCKALINKLTRMKKGVLVNENAFLEFRDMNKLNKSGNYQTNWIAFNISKVVKAQIKDSNLNIVQAITKVKK